MVLKVFQHVAAFGLAILEGPFFKNETSNDYSKWLQEFIWHQLEHINFDELWFQQDDVTCHTAVETLFMLRRIFEKS